MQLPILCRARFSFVSELKKKNHHHHNNNSSCTRTGIHCCTQKRDVSENVCKRLTDVIEQDDLWIVEPGAAKSERGYETWNTRIHISMNIQIAGLQLEQAADSMIHIQAIQYTSQVEASLSIYCHEVLRFLYSAIPHVAGGG